MANSKIKKTLCNTIDKLCGEVKLFGHPVEDFDFEDMTKEEAKQIKKVLLKKIERYATI